MFYDARRPEAFVCPCAVLFEVEDYALVRPVLQVVRRVCLRIVVLPALLTVRRGVQIVLACLLAIHYLGIGKQPRYHRIFHVRCHVLALQPVRPGLQPVVFIFRQSHERSVLRAVHTLYVLRIAEIAHVFVGLADAVAFRVRRIFDVPDAPCRVACELERRHTLAFFLALEVYVVVGHRLAPRSGERFCRGGEQSGLSALFLYHHVEQPVGFKIVYVGVYRGISPVEHQSRLCQRGEALVGVRVVHTVICLLGPVPQRVVNEVSAPSPVAPLIRRVPEYLRSPHTVYRAPVLVHVR